MSSVMADHLAHQPMEDYQPLKFDFLDKDIMAINGEKIIGNDEGPELGERWTLMFEGASNAMSHGIYAVLMSPNNYHLPFTSKLCFDCTNNIDEYKACILGLGTTIDLRIKILEVYGDSALVIHHIRGD